MAVDDTLDYTPKRIFSDFAFRSEKINSIAIAIVTSLILANIGSILSKCIHACEKDTFRYQAWLRAVIFASTDDPIRLLSWFCRRYNYRDLRWKRANIKPKRKRLLWPLLARAVYVFASIIIIALSVPMETTQSGCGSGDYRIALDILKAQNSSLGTGMCLPVPMTSRLGDVASFCQYCYLPRYFLRQPNQIGNDTYLQVSHTLNSGFMDIIISSTNFTWEIVTNVQFHSLNDKEIVYMLDIREFSLDDVFDVALAALQNIDKDCTTRERRETTVEDNYRHVASFVNCDIPDKGNSPKEYLDMVAAFFKTAVQWKKSPGPKSWIKYNGIQREFTTECPVTVSVVRPIINVFESMIALAVAVFINIVVSFYVKGKGNAIDASYHIVKEALGFDSTTNPLEENVEQDENLRIELRRWECTRDGEGHVGFLGRPGDVAVEEFPAEMIVGGCKVAAQELEFFQRYSFAGHSKASEFTEKES